MFQCIVITLESVDLENNLLQGVIPDSIATCGYLERINLSANNFIGLIPTAFGEMKSLEVIRLHQNKISGSIPMEIFGLSNIKVLMLRSNRLIGIIASEIGNLKNATIISLNHNLLQGELPKEIGFLEQLEILHIHFNRIIGSTPAMIFKNKEPNTYISDCGNPMFLLPGVLECESCTICCNSDGFCQEKDKWKAPIWLLFSVVAFLIPLILSLMVYGNHLVNNAVKFLVDHRDPTSVYRTDSVYCFIISTNKKAQACYIVTASVQIMLYIVYMRASNVNNEDTDWSFTLRCPDNAFECKETNTVGRFGWFLFCIVNTFFLGSDVLISFLQIRKAVILRDFPLFVSGYALYAVTTPAVFVSYVYNLASAVKNTDLITNAVILLFINDLDERFMDLLTTITPRWTEARIDEVVEIMSSKIATTSSLGYESGTMYHVEEKSTDSEESDQSVVLTRFESGLKILGFDHLT